MPLTHDQIAVMYRRAFGNEAQLESVQELGGGTFNETYRVELSGKTCAILRAAPPPTADIHWDDLALMRREHQIRPFFASIATLMPTTILADFTHQVVERDYVFQTCIEGERWSDVEEELTPDENAALWHQCGEIVRRIHDTTGERFGYPCPGPSYPGPPYSGPPYVGALFARWSEMILDRLARIAESMVAHQLEVEVFNAISDHVRANASLLDEIQVPHLLHGDLWTFNLLIRRGDGGPAITGVLDADRAWWGDPMADWIMFLLAIRQDEPEWQGRLSAFYEGYGTPDHGRAAQFRLQAYKAMHIGTAVVGSARTGDVETIARGIRDLREIAQARPLL